jgi:hypothetical protein
MNDIRAPLFDPHCSGTELRVGRGELYYRGLKGVSRLAELRENKGKKRVLLVF